MATSRQLVLDSGALSALAAGKRFARDLVREALTDGATLVVPAVVLAESLTGTARDAAANRILADAVVAPITEGIARSAAELRHLLRLRGQHTIDACVVAIADVLAGSVIATGDENDLRALTSQRGRSRVIPI